MMKEQTSARNAKVLYAITAVYFILFVAAYAGIHILGLGQDRFALAYGALLAVLCIPLGILVPILHGRYRSGRGQMISLGVLAAILCVPHLRGGLTPYEIAGIVGIVLGSFVGYLIWKGCIDGKIDFSQAQLD